MSLNLSVQDAMAARVLHTNLTFYCPPEVQGHLWTPSEEFKAWYNKDYGIELARTESQFDAGALELAAACVVGICKQTQRTVRPATYEGNRFREGEVYAYDEDFNYARGIITAGFAARGLDSSASSMTLAALDMLELRSPFDRKLLYIQNQQYRLRRRFCTMIGILNTVHYFGANPERDEYLKNLEIKERRKVSPTEYSNIPFKIMLGVMDHERKSLPKTLYNQYTKDRIDQSIFDWALGNNLIIGEKCIEWFQRLGRNELSL